MMRFANNSKVRFYRCRLWPNTTVLCTLVATFLISGAISDVSAHRVQLIGRVEGDTVVVEAYVSGGSKVKGARTEVFDSSGKKVLEGRTDDKGVYSFKLSDIPGIRGDLRILLAAGMGHDTEYILHASELPSPTVPRTAGPPPEKNKTGESAKPDRIVQGNDLETIRSVVSQAVEEKIEPLLKMVANQQKLLLEQKMKGPTVAEIVGGIGWILGIVGIAAYFMGRNRKER